MSAPGRMFRRWRLDQTGSAAVEFALVLPALAMLIIGTMSAAHLTGVVNSMHFAVEEAARCSAVNDTVCGSPSQVVAYANSKYMGMIVQPTFVATSAGCGHTVTATATYQLSIAVTTLDVPLSATSCFPGVED